MNDKTKGLIGPEQNGQLESRMDLVSGDKDLRKLVQQEAFVEQELEIELAPSTNENDPPCAVVNVNGINQPIWRGVVTRVRRKYVEVLARMKETRYSQRPTNYINPEESNALIPRTGLVYPFEVLEDPHPRGRAWLRAILSEPV